jgi:hypothetical protein
LELPEFAVIHWMAFGQKGSKNLAPDFASNSSQRREIAGSICGNDCFYPCGLRIRVLAVRVAGVDLAERKPQAHGYEAHTDELQF